MAETTAITAQKKSELAASERFTNAVLKEFGGNVAGAIEVTDYQRKLIQGYFIGIDRALKAAEEERVRKNEKNRNHDYDNNLPVTWEHVNMKDLALDLMYFARIGLDMSEDNMLFPIPYKNNKRNNYDINLMKGYNGIRFIAEKYALVKPKNVTVEVVYSNDEFRPIKKDAHNVSDNYEFTITDAFDRGKIIGGFAYIEYDDKTKNELIIMTMADIEKRKPAYASANFWGGTIKREVNGILTETETEGWLYEMVRKTIMREAYSAKHILIDSAKKDDAYAYMKSREVEYVDTAVQAEIDNNANMVQLESGNGEVVDTTTGEVTPLDDVPTEPNF